MDWIGKTGARNKTLAVAFGLLAGTLLAGAALRGAPGGQGATGAGAITVASGASVFSAPAAGPVQLSARLDRTAVLAGGDGLVRVELVVRADGTQSGSPVRVPTDLVVVLDRSGSMAGEKIEHARAAIRAIVQELAPEDGFALVTYSSDAELPVPLTRASEASRAGWLRIVDATEPAGGTNIASGLDLGLDVIAASRVPGRAPRVILLSDGLANLGDASPEGLRGRAQRAAVGEFALSTVGVGLDFDEQLMSQLADAGTGNFYFLENAVDLAEIFRAEFASARETVATGLALAIQPATGVQVLDAAGYPLERTASGAVTLRPGSLFVGQERRIWVTLRVPVSDAGERPLGGFSASFTRDGQAEHVTLAGTPAVQCVADAQAAYSSVSPDDWARAVAVEEVNALRREAASDIKAGKQEAAVARIRRYQADTAAQNAYVGSPLVAGKLAELDDLAKDVQASVAALPPAKERAAKKLQAKGLAESRAGSRKLDTQ
jgi:Ca-activated chloride channel family protein